LKIFPNPTNKYLTVKLTGNSKRIESAQVFNLLGQEMPNKLVSKKTNEIILNLSELNSGLYLLRAAFETGEVVNTPFIKE